LPLLQASDILFSEVHMTKKQTLITALSLLLTACAKNDRQPDLVFNGSANQFSQTEKRAFGGIEAIENSFVFVSGKLFSFFDPAATGEMRRRDMENGATLSVLPNNARFSYVMENEGELLNFVTIDGDIYRSRSTDGGLTWIDQVKVIEAERVQWNPGVARDSLGGWHMLIESSETGVGPFQGDVGCYYFTSADGLEWTAHGRVIDKCGNPYLVFTSRGLLVIHGDLRDVWWTTASTFDGTTWTTHREKLDIGSPGVHVCDPHAIEKDGKIILSVSVDQNSITLTESNETLEQLHERILQ
jgi:hypothetical protein